MSFNNTPAVLVIIAASCLERLTEAKVCLNGSQSTGNDINGQLHWELFALSTSSTKSGITGSRPFHPLTVTQDEPLGKSDNLTLPQTQDLDGPKEVEEREGQTS